MRASVRISQANRDRLARVASDELGGATLDEALGVLLLEHESGHAMVRLAADPDRDVSD